MKLVIIVIIIIGSLLYKSKEKDKANEEFLATFNNEETYKVERDSIFDEIKKEW